MRQHTRQRLLIGGTLVAVLGFVGGLWWYPAWRFSRDFREAERAIAAYDFATARDLLARCEARRPADPLVHLAECRVARRMGDIAAAREHLSRYLRLVPKSTPESLLEYALLDAQEGRIAEVFDELAYQIDAKHPRSEEILEALAAGCAQMYNFDRASFWVMELLSRAPANPIGRLIRAQTLITLGRVDQAVEALRELVRDFPRNVEAWNTLGDAMMILKQTPAAVEAYAQARSLAPDDAKALLGLGRAQFLLGNIDAVRVLVPDLERQAELSEASFLLGRLAILDQRWGEAEALLRKALKLSPNDHEVHRELAVSLYQLGRPDEARRHLDRVRELEAELARLEKIIEAMLQTPLDPNLKTEAGKLCLRNGQVSEGLRWLFGALELAPKHKPTHQALADFYATQGDTQRATHHRRLAQ